MEKRPIFVEDKIANILKELAKELQIKEDYLVRFNYEYIDVKKVELVKQISE